MGDVKPALTTMSDDVWARTRARVEGLTDEEYFWEPAPGCWSVRQRGDGRWAAEHVVPSPSPEPLTTIAWRLWHLTDMYGEDRAPRWLDVPAHGPAIGRDDPEGAPPANAADAVALLERAHDRWDAHLHLVSEDQLAQPIGAVGGPYADRSKASYVLHMMDEFVHHAAEVALLRDLWRWTRGPISADPLVERVIRGDPGVVDEVDDVAAAGELVDRAAAYARWDLLVALLERGAPVPTAGRTPLHLAAGAGEVGVVRVLLDHGADPTATDPDFRATPAQWAEFLGQPAVAEVLRSEPG